MAKKKTELTMDAQQLIAEFAKVETAFKSHTAAVTSTTATYADFFQTSNNVKIGFERILDSGEKVEGYLKRVRGSWKEVITSVDLTTAAIKNLAAAQQTQAGAVDAAIFMRRAGIPDAAGLKAALQNTYRVVQEDLAKALGSDTKNFSIADNILKNLKSGIVEVKTGIERDIQVALQKVLTLSERIADVQAKGARASTPAVQQTQSGVSNAAAFMSSIGIPDAAGMKASIISNFSSVQKDLAKALGADPANMVIANEIFANLKRGVTETSDGIRDKIQTALINVLRLSERIADAQAKATKSLPVAPVGPPNISQAELATARSNISSAFPINTSASLSSIAAYQAAINNLVATVTRTKVSFQEFQLLLSNVSQKPTQDFAGTNQQLAQVQQSIQRVAIAHDTMKKSSEDSAAAGGKGARSLYISFEQFVKLLEVQVIHRFFGNLITSMQSSIAKAAELQVKIAEIMTISQGSNLSSSGLEVMIRQASEQFNRPQTDIAEGLYQAFSNQVIKSAADLEVFNQALRLSRITVSSVKDSVNLLSSVMRAYNLTNVEAKETVDALFKAVELGRFRVVDIADTIGRIMVLSSQLGIARNEILAITAHLSVTGLRPSETETQVSAIMNSFLKPSQKMSEILRSWGFDSGEATLQVMTLTQAIARLQREVMSGNVTLSDISPNIRSMRGLTGARDTAAIDEARRALDNAAPDADRANTLVQESFGTKFQQEIIKTQNLMTAFGNVAMQEITRLTEPWGGLASIVDQVGGAFGQAGIAGLQIAGILNNLSGVLKLVGGDLGTVVKLYLDYKAASLALSVATGIVTTAQTVHNALLLQAQARVAASIVTTELDVLARGMSAAGAAAQSAALGVNTVVQLTNTVATTKAVYSQYALAAASRVASAALIASPYILLGGAVLALTGQLQPLIDKFNGVEEAANRLRDSSERVQTTLTQQNQDQTAQIRDREREFSALIDRTQRLGGAVFADLTAKSNALVDGQRRVVENTTNNMKVALRGASDEIANRIRDIDRILSESRAAVRESIRRTFSFADRDSSDAFRRSFDALSRRPEFIAPIDRSTDQGDNQFRQELIKFQIESQQFDMQKQLIQQRMNQLLQEANQLVLTGDAESMQSARRKFEEVKRLTEQQFSLQTDFNRRTQEHGILTGQVAAGPGGLARYIVPVQQLNQELGNLTRMESEAEAALQRRQAIGQQAAEQERVALRARQEALTLAIRGIEQFRVANNAGELNARFQGPQGMANFNADFNALRASLDAAMTAANTSDSARLTISAALLAQQRDLRLQVEHEVTGVTLRNERLLFEERLRNVQTLRQQLVQSETAFGETRSRFLTSIGTDLTAMQSRVNNAFTLITGSPRLSLTGGVNLDPRGQQIIAGQAAFNAAQPELINAREAYVNSIGTDQEAAAFTRLQAAIQATSTAYRQLFGLAGANNLNGSNITGNTVGNTPTAMQANIQTLLDMQQQQAAVRQQIEQSQRQVNELNAQVQEAANRLGIAQQGVNNFGGALGAQVQQVNNFAEAVRRLADQLERARAAPIVLPGGVSFEQEGFASGGLIGGRFNTFGPDDRIAQVRTGEFIMNPESTSRFYPQLVAMNAGSFASGGVVGNSSSVTNVGDISVNVHDSGDPGATARSVLATLRREFRRGNGKPG